jgi:hypothetical protein
MMHGPINIRYTQNVVDKLENKNSMPGLILDEMIIFNCILKKGCSIQSSDSEQRKMAGCSEDVDSPSQAGGIFEQLLKYLFLRTVAVQCACPRTYRLLSLLSCRRGCDNLQATLAS